MKTLKSRHCFENALRRTLDWLYTICCPSDEKSLYYMIAFSLDQEVLTYYGSLIKNCV